MTGLPLFRFEMDYVIAPDDPYLTVRWDLSKRITVVAHTQQGAINKADAALGGSENIRYGHYQFRVQSITEHSIPEGANND